MVPSTKQSLVSAGAWLSFAIVASEADSLTPIHTWTKMTPTTHTVARWVNHSHVTSTILKLRSHMSPQQLCEGKRQLVSNY